MSPVSLLRIRELNDRLRAMPFAPHGQLLLTSGVADLPAGDIAAILRLVTTFDAFTLDNDPHGEHDFGAFTYGETRYFWKIDYYDRDRTYASPDPADPAVTSRILTVMRADEH
ncbi:DUF3768 domain-containing protein [Rhizobium rhizogenes]|uniref:DUF3768 domain-containing protein n=1 Tax=Rhizobium rhizogenes TaxID=359 RepID=A0AA92BYW7_RHIRH|nr:DUF3768 domain-containing protein [Rhizobium rhizogenes]PVE49880.1 hypothetical protein DC430_23565 [Rhizobium rhizogenes]PVE61994.1 hypothetical protein DC415_23895 [Agrobacterium tumefaciens]PVE69758.1 hypothetical protein DCP16_23895 [Sphingomonas sp. TPD3009]